MSKITLYKKPFELDRVRHNLIFLFRFMLLGDIIPPDYPLYELELKDGALFITASMVSAAGSGSIGGADVAGLDEISFVSLDKKKKELSFDAAGRGRMSFWYRKNESRVEEFYNELVRSSSKIQS